MGKICFGFLGPNWERVKSHPWWKITDHLHSPDEGQAFVKFILDVQETKRMFKKALDTFLNTSAVFGYVRKEYLGFKMPDVYKVDKEKGQYGHSANGPYPAANKKIWASFPKATGRVGLGSLQHVATSGGFDPRRNQPPAGPINCWIRKLIRELEKKRPYCFHHVNERGKSRPCDRSFWSYKGTLVADNFRITGRAGTKSNW